MKRKKRCEAEEGGSEGSGVGGGGGGVCRKMMSFI